MKKLFLIIMLLSVFIGGIASAALTYDEIYYMQHLSYLHSGSSVTDPLYLFMNESIGYLEGSTGFGYIYLTPTDTEPGTTEGMYYYDNSEDTIRLYTASGWVSMDKAGASSLNTAYGIGSKIDASTSYVEIEVDDGDNNMALLLDGDENTNNNTVMQITNAGAGIAIDIDGTDGYDIEGTAAAFRVNYTGAVECVGITNTAGDVLWDDTYDLFWDTSKDLLLANDSTLIGWGGASGDDPDFWFIYDGTDFNLNAKTANDDLKFGENIHFDLSIMCATTSAYWKFDTDDSAKLMIFEGTDAIFMDGDFCIFGDNSDFTIDSSTADNLDIVASTSDESSVINIGADTSGVDMRWYAATTAYTVRWDASEEEFLYTSCDVQLDDGSYLRLGSAGDGDITHQWDGTNYEIFTAKIDTPLALGDITYGFDLTYYFETAGQFRTDYDADFINLTDDMELRFGTGVSSDGDFKISSNSSNILQIEQVSLDTGTIEIGVDNRDIPIKWYAETASSYFQLTGDDVNIEAMNLALGDGDSLLFGDTLGTGDFSITDTSDKWVFDVVSAGVGEIEVGNDADDVPLKWFGETTGAFFYFVGDALQVDKADIAFSESDGLLFGDTLGTGDIRIDSAAAIMTIGQVSAGTGSLVIGVDDAGMDVTIPGDTTGKFMMWDTSADALIVNGQYDIGTVATFTDSDATPDVHGHTYWNTNTTGVTILDFDGTGIADGQIIYVVSKGAIVYDMDGGLLEGGSTDITTAAGDLTVWLYDGTDWILISFTDQSADLS